jgi:Lipocalin-like domain
MIFGVFLPREESAAQTTAKDLVRTWTLVSKTIEQDGKKTDLFGPNPQGQETRAANGHVSVIITRSDLPKFASTIARQELQKKTRPSCRGALPTSA